MEFISSFQNPKIKFAKKLEKAAFRKEESLFIAEGLRETVLAFESGFTPKMVFVCKKLYVPDLRYNATELLNSSNCYEVSEEVYKSMAYRDSTEGVIGVFETKKLPLFSFQLSKNPLLLVIEQTEKPGNLGAMLRTADACGVDAVILCDTKTDIYNPNVIRASLGTVFTNKIGVGTPEEVLAYLKQHNISSYAAFLSGESKLYSEFEYKSPTAFIMGAESIGLSSFWVKNSNHKVIIPMNGRIDSLNLSVSAAVLLYEAVRQRS